MRKNNLFLLILLVALLLIFNMINILYFSGFIELPFVPSIGKATNTLVGTVSLLFEKNNYVYILNPQNTTYSLTADDLSLDLNVSANFSVNTWWYSLWDLTHNRMVIDNTSFTPLSKKPIVGK